MTGGDRRRGGRPASPRGVRVPEALAAHHADHSGAAGRAWIAALPRLAADRLDAWELRVDGPAAHGMVALVLPVRRPDGTPAALKLQPVDEETSGEPVALRAWNGRGAVRLLEHHPASGSMLLERLDAGRSLAGVPDDLAALRLLAGLLGRLTAVPAPAGLRRLADLAAPWPDRAAEIRHRFADPADRRVLDGCAAVLRDLLGGPPPGRAGGGDSGAAGAGAEALLHWDLHYENVLGAPGGGPEPRWVAIDPKPLAGDPGFDLFPALHNRWPEVLAGGDPARAVLRRFDLMTGIVGLDRRRAAGWTLARVLQTALWEAEAGSTELAEDQRVVGAALLAARV